VSKLLKLSFVLLSTVVLVASENPWVGTWKLDPAKSKLQSSPKAAKEMTVMVRDLGDGTSEVTMKGTSNDGSPIFRRNINPQGGGATRFLEGAPPAGIAENATVIGNKVRDTTTTLDGKTVSTSHLVVSEDGKTITITTKGVTPDGKPLDQIVILEKQ
jgi:hypothetical protein